MLQNRYVFITSRCCSVARVFLIASLIVVNVVTAAAQAPSTSASPTQASGQGEEKKGTPRADPQPSDKTLKRWLDIDALSISTRYRFIDAKNGVTLNNAQQYQVVAKGRFKFDRDGKYSVYAGLFTGNAFSGGWNNTGLGTGDTQTNLYLKQLYFDAKPKKWLEFQVGGIAVNFGDSTEITTYDNDNYLTGGRVQFRRPKDLYFDEVSITFAHLGDLLRPSVFRRLKHIDDSNYHQFLVRKQVNKHVSFSADYTFESGRDFLHEAVKLKVPESHLFDTVLFESYQRVDRDRGIGFNLYGEKVFLKKFTLGGGFARIERPLLNSDRFPQGNRFYLLSTYKITPEFSLNTALIRGVSGMPTPLTHRTRLEIIFSYNILESLHRLKVL